MYSNDPNSLSTSNGFQQRLIDDFRANAGVVGGPFDGSSLLLLTTVGARSRRHHTTPLGYVDIEGKRIVVASAGGADRSPAWLHNLRAHPVVTVEVGDETYRAVATILPGADRDRLWEEVVRGEPGYGDYQQLTTRVIPLVELNPLVSREGLDRVRGMGDFLKEVHQWLSAELDVVLMQVDTLIAANDITTPVVMPPMDLHAQLRERCLAFCGALERHHTGEDFGAFPMLAEALPALAPTLEKLRTEHVVVAETNRSIRELLEGYVPGASDIGELRDTLDGLVSRLREHFAFEEAAIAEALNAVADAPPLDGGGESESAREG
ncbi:nitroreductase family deazaflavin-dependent oxidoreductase [Rhodococcus sp. ABRD24]|uniref:nitroreductase/quinone reductase family protein n=1 Tax=Rhodococcus sp. ABRD24 TaxID=2507582 RepID=UPI00103A6ED0|nr:nitroreductase/quinone reductase family protein [Rhodococcus sp. ABRD24]QBJ97236.1 nitroreductase family deazaflavin-dependent oxidoreductase [Rhodococcus sp. ABRD24]